jgi:hypothetical protein
MQMAAGKFPPPSRYVGRLPAALDGWFRRAMNPKPEGRFASVKVMAEVLSEIVGPDFGESIDELSTSMGPASRARIVDELSSISGEGDPLPPSSGNSQPAKYDLFGPDSEAFGMQGTLMMDMDDHRYAEAKAEQPVGPLDKPSDDALPSSNEDAAPTPRLHRYEGMQFKTEPSGIQPLPEVPSEISSGGSSPSPSPSPSPPPAPAPAPRAELPAWLAQASEGMNPARTWKLSGPEPPPAPPEPNLEEMLRNDASQRRLVYAVSAVLAAVVVLVVIVTLVI